MTTLTDTLINFFIPSAFADTATPAAASAQSGGGMSFFIMMGALILFMYLVIWRPQSKKMKEQRDLINSVAKGDEVITAGGILGTVLRITDNYIVISPGENVEIRIQKSSVTGMLPKGTLKSI